MNRTVDVLLSTFNGERFLPDLLDSLRLQSHDDWKLSVRDDGSSDRTLEILESCRPSFPGMRLSEGENIGVVGSFFTLLREADSKSAYFAFCDQDDVWKPEKLADAVRRFEEADPGVPALCCTRVEFVDEALRPLGFSRSPRKTGFGNALVENVSAGCTFVLNASAREWILSSLPERALMHDWWCYLVVSGFGTVLCDDTPQVRYRQHGKNTVGGTSNRLLQIARRTRRFLSNADRAYRVTDQAREFSLRFADRLEPGNRAVLDAFLRSRENFLSRFRYGLSRMGVWRQSPMDTLILRMLILAGRY